MLSLVGHLNNYITLSFSLCNSRYSVNRFFLVKSPTGASILYRYDSCNGPIKLSQTAVIPEKIELKEIIIGII